MVSRRINWTFTGASPNPGGPGERDVRSLTAEDIDVVFQPIVSLESGDLLAYEALTRCKIPQFALTPVLFERAVEEQACGRLGHLIREVTFSRCTDQPLFVNVHPAELSSRWLVRPDNPLNFHEHQVYLEITEAAALAHFDVCLGTLQEVCKRIGAYLVVDDFGSGHSDMRRVLELRPSIVKLDGAYVRGIDTSEEKRRFVVDTVQACADLGARVVAEFIETPEELLACRRAGVHYGQGYLFGKPDHPPPPPDWLPSYVSG